MHRRCRDFLLSASGLEMISCCISDISGLEMISCCISEWTDCGTDMISCYLHVCRWSSHVKVRLDIGHSYFEGPTKLFFLCVELASWILRIFIFQNLWGGGRRGWNHTRNRSSLLLERGFVTSVFLFQWLDDGISWPYSDITPSNSFHL